MADYLFSYAYVVDGHWHFDHRVYEAERFTYKDMGRAQADAAVRHNKTDNEALARILIVPIAVSRLDSPNVRIKITKT